MNVWVLVGYTGYDARDVGVVGVFSSLENADKAREKLVMEGTYGFEELSLQQWIVDGELIGYDDRKQTVKK